MEIFWKNIHNKICGVISKNKNELNLLTRTKQIEYDEQSIHSHFALFFFFDCPTILYHFYIWKWSS